VIIEEVDRDRYGRLVAKGWLDSRGINREMVAEGQACVYRRYMRDPTLFDDQERARGAKPGLRELPETQRFSPWEWRRRWDGRPHPADQVVHQRKRSAKS
jgi:endonuclease YncB( thermonuclease family)